MSEPEARALVHARLEQILGHRFANPELLETALRHASHAHEAGGGEGGGESNERLEFLGDAVLGLVVAHALYAARPDWREGDLTRALHALVDARSLARLARELELGGVLLLGRTERSSGGHEKASILADAMEAVLGALYLDGGLEAVERFLRARFGEAFEAGGSKVARDPKTELQERTMAAVGCVPTYRLVVDSGIEGDDQRFTIEVCLRGEVLARATDRTKRAAEREAAQSALGGGAVACSASPLPGQSAPPAAEEDREDG
ncbi:MAG: ribonuclease III [Deltaproteobacteria bacterium]|nr:ribonuclease III [Deltaproteobacteria bacterium]